MARWETWSPAAHQVRRNTKLYQQLNRHQANRSSLVPSFFSPWFTRHQVTHSSSDTKFPMVHQAQGQPHHTRHQITAAHQAPIYLSLIRHQVTRVSPSVTRSPAAHQAPDYCGSPGTNLPKSHQAPSHPRLARQAPRHPRIIRHQVTPVLPGTKSPTASSPGHPRLTMHGSSPSHPRLTRTYFHV